MKGKEICQRNSSQITYKLWMGLKMVLMRGRNRKKGEKEKGQ